MATRSAIFIQTATGEWLAHYCHWDGYPSHMAPALQAAKPADILAARELRSIADDGTVEGYREPREPDTQEKPEFPGWAQHAYVLTATGWRHAASQAELEAATAA